MLEQDEARLTNARIVELYLKQVQGEFDVAHLREVHRRIFQDLPHHGSGDQSTIDYIYGIANDRDIYSATIWMRGWRRSG